MGCCESRDRQDIVRSKEKGGNAPLEKVNKKKKGPECPNDADFYVDAEYVGINCHEGFDLVFRRDPRERSPYFGKTYTHCQLCHAEICDIRQGYATCENADEECDYDCCLACFKGELPEGLKPGNTCGMAHPLQLRSTCKNRDGATGASISCDMCKAAIAVWGGYYTCEEDCNYDICKNCYKP